MLSRGVIQVRVVWFGMVVGIVIKCRCCLRACSRTGDELKIWLPGIVCLAVISSEAKPASAARYCFLEARALGSP